MLTKKQKQILDFITRYAKNHGLAPSLEEIKEAFKLRSVSTIHEHISILEAKGYLHKQRNQPRGIGIPKSEKMITIPLLGTIAAGQPIEAIQERETLAIPQNKLPRSGNIFALRVVGDSMIDENINNGDVILVKEQSTAENGQKVVALIDNHEATLKKFYKERRQIRLQPANSSIKPIMIEPSQLLIQGVVVDIIKSKKEPSKNLPNYTLIEQKKPKGGCELTYRGKESEETVISNTIPATLKPVKKYSSHKINRLLWGDNLNILKTLYEDSNIRGNVGLIYIDPPFGTGQDFVGYDEEKAYSDRLVNAEFLEFLRKRLIFLKELLSDGGSIYLHIDQKIGHYVKILMDEVFGEENFRNDITRIKCNPKNFERKAFGNIKDVIYFYSKAKHNSNDSMCWSDYRLPLSEEEISRQFSKVDKFGKRYATTPLHAKGETRNGPTGQLWKGLKPPKGRHWRYNPKELTRLDKENLIEWSSTGNPRKIIYAHENKGKKVQDIWDFKDAGFEKSSYPTEKNEDLLKQIILASSKEGDIVLDCFAGSGTTLAVAEKLNRAWIGVDSNEEAIKVAEKRLSNLSGENTLFSKPSSFSIYKAT